MTPRHAKRLRHAWVVLAGTAAVVLDCTAAFDSAAVVAFVATAMAQATRGRSDFRRPPSIVAAAPAAWAGERTGDRW